MKAIVKVIIIPLIVVLSIYSLLSIECSGGFKLLSGGVDSYHNENDVLYKGANSKSALNYLPREWLEHEFKLEKTVNGHSYINDIEIDIDTDLLKCRNKLCLKMFNFEKNTKAHLIKNFRKINENYIQKFYNHVVYGIDYKQLYSGIVISVVDFSKGLMHGEKRAEYAQSFKLKFVKMYHCARQYIHQLTMDRGHPENFTSTNPYSSSVSSTPIQDSQSVSSAINQHNTKFNKLEDFDLLFHIIDGKADKINQKLDRKINKYQHHKLNVLKPIFTEKLQKLNELAFNHTKIIGKAIIDVDCIPMNISFSSSSSSSSESTDGVKLFNNNTDEECVEFITRDKMRQLFKEAVDDCEHFTNEVINDELNEYVDEINEELGELRELYVDFFEEWADSLMNELKNTLVYQDLHEHVLKNLNIENEKSHLEQELKMIESGHQEEDDNDDTEENELLRFLNTINEDDNNSTDEEAEDIRWDKYMGLKRKMIKKRKELTEKLIKVNELDQFIRDIKNHLKILSREGTENFMILRARANLQFQAREEEEYRQKMLEKERKEQEEEERKNRELSKAAEATESAEQEADDDDDDGVITEVVTEVVVGHVTETFTQTSSTVIMQTQTELVL
ncbi:hypothetical protein ACO0QE_000894 [Hanseniaspora vineae]